MPRRRKDRGGPGGAAPTVPAPDPPRGGTETLDLDPGTAPGEQALKRRARNVERQRAAAEVRRSRAAYRQGTARQDRAAREHRSSLLVMVILLGLLIATVVVSGGLLAASMHTRPVTLAAPLHIYPVAQTVPGQCPAGTRGISGQASSGPACYRLSQGIAIRKVAGLRPQKARTGRGYDVAVTLRTTDRRAFATLTRATVNRDLAFVVRNRLVTAPRVDTPVLDGKVVITGPADRAGADRLVRSLKGR